MARDTERRRTELRERLVDIAEAEVRRNGIGALRARTLAEEAGCAVGAIYTVFEDLNQLILAVNMRTFHRIGVHVAKAVEGREAKPPVERMIAMAEAYVDFASEELNLWRAFFGIELTADSDFPAWYLDELDRLFGAMSAPIAQLDPAAPRDEIMLRTRTLFSAVHGVMLLSLERRISGVPRDQLKPMIGYLLRAVARPR